MDDKVTVWVAGIQVVSEREILIGSSDSAQIRISHLPANVAVVKKNAGEWFLSLRDRSAVITGTKERRVFLGTAESQIEIRGNGYEIVVVCQVDVLNHLSSSSGQTDPQKVKPSPSGPKPEQQHTQVSGISSDEFPVGAVRSIGSGSDVDYRIDDPSVERHHATLTRRDSETIVLSDRGSATGTYIEGRAITRASLQAGQIVSVGGVSLRWPTDFKLRSSVPIVRRHPVEHALVASGLSIRYPNAARATLRDVNVKCEQGSLTAILGPSGIGKSTLCRTVLGELEASSGELTVVGVTLDAGQMFNPGQVSFVPQETDLLPGLTVTQTLDLAVRARSAKTLSTQERQHTVRRVIERLSIGDVEENLVTNLSGGQKRRVSIALELISNPMLLMLDEPCSGLDEGLDRKLMRELRDIAHENNGPSILVVTHATNHLDECDSLIAIGGAVTESGEKTATVRYKGPPDRALDELNVRDYDDAMDSLREPTGVSGGAGDDRKRNRFHQRFSSLDMAQSFKVNLRRDWLLFKAPASEQRWWKAKSRGMRSLLGTVFLSGIIAGLLWAIEGKGLSSSSDVPNHGFMTVAGLLVLLLAFWGVYRPAMNIVAEWPALRREQRWGVSAAMHIVARIVSDFPIIVLCVGMTTTALKYLLESPTAKGLLPPYILLFLILLTSTFVSYLIGVLIGCSYTHPVKAIQRVVAVIAVMIVEAGIIFHLPDVNIGGVKFLDIFSNIVPPRLAIAAIASSFDATAATHRQNLESYFVQDMSGVYCFVGGMLVIGLVAFIASMLVIPRTLRTLDHPKK